MLTIPKTYLVDENQQPVAVQVPIATFQHIEEVLENYGLAQMISEEERGEEEQGEDAKKYYESLPKSS